MLRQRYANSPLRLDWAFEGLSPTDTHRGTHAYHSYPMRFVPQLAESLVVRYSAADEVVCDPFMGSGTTLVEAALKGRQALGSDINPLCILVTQTKSTLIDPVELAESLDQLEDHLTRLEEFPPFPLSDEVVERLCFWHPVEVFDQLARILTIVRSVQNPRVLRLYECAFSQILKSCSLWWPGSTRAIRSQKRSRKPQIPRRALLRQLRLMSRRNALWWESSGGVQPIPVSAHLADARQLPFGDGSVDTIITSPPYVTSYDYAELHQLSLLWLGYFQTYQELRSDLIGAQYGVKQSAGSATLAPLSETAFRIVTQLETATNERHLPRAVNAYFHDMWLAIAEMYRVLRPGGKVIIVIGNTVLRGIEMLNAEVLGEMLEGHGFRPVDIFRRPIPVKSIPSARNEQNGQFTSATGRNPYAEEYVLVFQK